MLIDFTGKTAIVTGGANGIGLATAKLFAASGAQVYILDLASENPQQAAADFGATGFPIDVRDRASVEAAFEKVPTPDVVAINAGIAPTSPIESTSEEMWRRMIDVNLTGAFFTLQTAARKMKARRAGSIVLTASTNSYDGEATLIAYNASKSGILGIVHTAANELGPFGVRVNAVCPGLIHTRLTAMYYEQPNALKEYFRHIPMGRGGTPQEVAQAITFLASDAASFINGATLLVDGGQMACKYSLWNDELGSFQNGRWTLS